MLLPCGIRFIDVLHVDWTFSIHRTGCKYAGYKKCGEKFKRFHIIHQVNKLAYFKDLVELSKVTFIC